jgi:hypothetical protein
MIFGVDGTGPFFDESHLGGFIEGYKDGMKQSFVSQICGLTGEAWQPHAVDLSQRRVYWRGPDATSLFGAPKPAVVARWAEMYHRNGEKVYLTGYSRGAAVVIDAATELNAKGIPVEAMFLFDAVNEFSRLDGAVIPANVGKCFHALISGGAGSRTKWQRCGLISAAKSYMTKEFTTTHGGMGGAPWGRKGLIAAGSMGVAELRLSAAQDNDGAGGVITPEQMAAAMVHDQPHKYADKIYEGALDWRFTNVSIDQEHKGMREVAAWMEPMLRGNGIDVSFVPPPAPV